jgi:hypothetical protein
MERSQLWVKIEYKRRAKLTLTRSCSQVLSSLLAERETTHAHRPYMLMCEIILLLPPARNAQ